MQKKKEEGRRTGRTGEEPVRLDDLLVAAEVLPAPGRRGMRVALEYTHQYSKR